MDPTNLMHQVCELCQRLVRVPSLSGDEEQVAALVQRQMSELGFAEVARDELGSVVGIQRWAEPGPTVVFDAHMDVVPAPQPEQWTHPPFGGVRQAGRVWGRGATDIKGSLAAMLLGLGSLLSERHRGTLVAAATVGEETMEGVALGRVLDRHPADCVVICEPTELQLALGHKGRVSLVVEAEGRAAHTSRPDNGINAVYRLAEALPRLRALTPARDPWLGQGVMELVEISSQPFPGSSMVPFHCTARFDRRLVRGETAESVLQELQQALRGRDGLTVGFQQVQLRCYTGQRLDQPAAHPCWVHDPDSELVRRARESLLGAGLSAEVSFAPYCTNGSESAGVRGIPSLIYGAGGIHDAHIVDEGVDEQALLAACHGYRALAAALLAQQGTSCRGLRSVVDRSPALSTIQQHRAQTPLCYCRVVWSGAVGPGFALRTRPRR